MQIAFETPDQADVRALIGELDAYLYSLYPPENVYAMDIASLLYERLGYRRRGPFGAYPDDPTSVFMEKTVA